MTHMKRFRTMVCVLVAITLMVTLLSGSAVATSANDRSKIVRFRPITTSLLCLLGRCIDLKTSEGMEKALAEVAASGGRVLHRLPFINALAVEFAESESATVGVLTDLLSSLYVLEVVDDLQTWVDPICPVLALQLIPAIYPWGQWQIEVPVVHQQLDTLPVQVSEATVAVLDTGIDWTDLTLGEFSQGNAGGYYVLDGEGSYHDNHGHGTRMAGIIAAARNYLGIIGAAGAAPQAKQAKLVAVKVLDQNGAGYLSDIVNDLQWIYDQNLNKPVTDRIRLVNMSFGFPSDSTPYGKPSNLSRRAA